MEQNQEGLCQGQSPRKKVNCDQECWIKDRIRDAIRMASVLESNRGVQANEYAYNYALEGIIEGQAIEIIRTLELEPEFVNIREPQMIHKYQRNSRL